MPLDFTGRTAIVTGGANGIGLACARALVSAGATVWILDLESERPGEAAEKVGARGIAADVSDRTSLEAAFEQAGVPDVVVANAGCVLTGEILTASESDWQRTLAVNLTGAFHTVQIAARQMKPRRSGSIVLMASTNSYDGEAGLTAYNASKAGMLGLLHTAANELGPYQIRINAVCPGLIRTRLTDSYFTQPEVLKDYFRDIPLGRGGEAEEVANAVLFLASEEAAFITGATLLVDGGQMAGKFGTWNEETAEFSTDRWRLRG